MHTDTPVQHFIFFLIQYSLKYKHMFTPTGVFFIPHIRQSPSDAECIPTAPSSPEPALVLKKDNNAYLPPELVLPARLDSGLPKDPVPIIVLPSDHAAVPALSPEDQAKHQLQLYVLRECQCHQSWKLGCQKENSTLGDWENAIGVSQKFWREVIEWILKDTIKALTPHEMRFDGLEAAQAELLFALGYVLGGTPVGILNELQEVLPSLHELFPLATDNEGEWDLVL
ncbi:hypothetical protein ARMGADRAFT_1078987 [Armillaria gallica]|uniref:Uncharacterized protein n=1 Tax=Armillaria gallica TaxID=47427 RepID=A0A2H3DKB1_ARMGA|nr:hypothetical protein ARMGADRAFT_1078987 [Armillaria gallica]